LSRYRLQETKAISSKTDIELEIFGHGALRFGAPGILFNV
jgi:collagenase-like PrtC family protease